MYKTFSIHFNIPHREIDSSFIRLVRKQQKALCIKKCFGIGRKMMQDVKVM